jgi:lycopene beta-cyclase
VTSARADVLLVGGGLANSLVAWRLARTRPELRVVVVESGTALGGNHTWSFHGRDVAPAQLEWLRPLVAHTWPRYDVRFPRRSRRLRGEYHCVPSARLHDVVSQALASDRVLLGRAARAVAPDHVRLEDGTRLDAPCVVDGRGDAGARGLRLGFQKFLGLELELDGDHGLDAPMLMDATVPQAGGFRFVYVLPLGPRRLLVEDTLYADTPALDAAALRRAIEAYVAARGWRVAGVRREERGVLPIPLGGAIATVLDAPPADVPKSGLRAALYHPTTGYSLPEAVRFADALAALRGEALRSAPLLAWQRERTLRLWRRGRFARWLNRMLFQAAEPGQRYRVLQRFYGLSEGLIARFYAHELSAFDRVRLLAGRPPVPVRRALGCLFETHTAPAGVRATTT